MNSTAQTFLAEFERELVTTRKFLERLPEDRLDWRPHEKSMPAGELAFHIASVPQGVLNLALTDEGKLPNFGARRPLPKSVKEVLDQLDASATHVRNTLPEVTDERMRQIFRMSREGVVVFEAPREVFLRAVMFNHWYHHRGQFGVYLRLVGAVVPSSYGPSGDE